MLQSPTFWSRDQSRVTRLDFHPVACFLSVRSERALLSSPGKGALQAFVFLYEFFDFCLWGV
jgi:hypothetical protein